MDHIMTKILSRGLWYILLHKLSCFHIYYILSIKMQSTLNRNMIIIKYHIPDLFVVVFCLRGMVRRSSNWINGKSTITERFTKSYSIKWNLYRLKSTITESTTVKFYNRVKKITINIAYISRKSQTKLVVTRMDERTCEKACGENEEILDRLVQCLAGWYSVFSVTAKLWISTVAICFKLEHCSRSLKSECTRYKCPPRDMDKQLP